MGSFKLKGFADTEITKEEFIDYASRCLMMGIEVCEDATFKIERGFIRLDMFYVNDSKVKIPSFVDSLIGLEHSARVRRNLSITSLDLNKVNTLERDCLRHYPYIREIYAPNVVTVGAEAFRSKQIKKIELPKVKYIGEKAFYHCIKLEKIVAPNLLVTGKEWLRECNSINKLIIPKIEVLNYFGYFRQPVLEVELNEHFKSYKQTVVYKDIKTNRTFYFDGIEAVYDDKLKTYFHKDDNLEHEYQRDKYGLVYINI